MKNSITTLIIALISYTTFGQQITYNQWKTEAETNIRLQPKYGNAIKTEGQKKADEELINEYLSREGTHRKASELLIKLGFDYFYKGDLKTAMYRFNQAWLLDPKNENVFWGFGAVYFMFQDFQSAIKQYNEGLTLNAKSSNIITDKASVFMSKYDFSIDSEDLNTAIKLFLKSYSIDNKNQNTLFKLSACYFFKSDCENSWKYYSECLKLGGKPITKEYTKALKEKCKK
jgi:tetratricopeptide (TPR) repeat protein